MLRGLDRKTIANGLFLNILVVANPLKNQDLVTVRRYELPFVVDRIDDS